MRELKSGCEDETTILSQPWSFSLSAIAKNLGLLFCNPYPRLSYADFSLHVKDWLLVFGHWMTFSHPLGLDLQGGGCLVKYWSLTNGRCPSTK